MRRTTKRKLLKTIDIGRIREAVEKAERMTSGEIRVSVSHFFWGSVQKVAEKAFVRLGMTRTRQKNGILFFIVPSRRRFAVIGDSGIHEKEGDAFWQKLVAVMSGHFQKGRFTEGLIAGIEEAGKQLSLHFPYNPAADVNELPDDVSFE